MPDDLARAFAFIARADLAGTRSVPVPGGRAILLPECPLRHDSNYVLVEDPPAGATADSLAAIAEEALGAAGLRHRCLFLRDTALGERLAPGFAALGWSAHRGVVMARRREPDAAVDLSPAVETTAEALRAAREASIREYPWGTAETARQLLDARSFLPVPARHFGVFVDGAPVAWIESYAEGDVAQVEALATVPAFRRRGYGSALLLRAAAEALRGGADLVFLCADAEDRPRHLYARLGFEAIGGYVKFTRA